MLFRNDKIHRTSFTKSKLNKIAMINCNLEEVVLNNSPVRNSRIRGVDSVAMVVINSPFTRNIFFNNKGMDKVVNSRVITNVGELTASKDLSNLNMAYLNLSGINVEQVLFKDTILRGAVLKDSIFRSCLFLETDFSEANLVGVDLSGSEIKDSIFIGAKLDNANLSLTKLINLDFTRASMNNVNYRKAQLSNVVGVDKKANAKNSGELKSQKAAPISR